MKTTFEVKQGSLKSFFLSIPGNENLVRNGYEDFDYVNFLKEEIIIPDKKIQEGFDYAVFEVVDRGRSTGFDFVVKYSYEILHYDDLSKQLVLIGKELVLKESPILI